MHYREEQCLEILRVRELSRNRTEAEKRQLQEDRYVFVVVGNPEVGGEAITSETKGSFFLLRSPSDNILSRISNRCQQSRAVLHPLHSLLGKRTVM